MHLLGCFECCYVVSWVLCIIVAAFAGVLSGFFNAFPAVGLLIYSEWV